MNFQTEIKCTVDNIEKRFGYFSTKLFIPILLICGISLAIRLYYFQYNIPITLDGAGYFWYAIDMKILHQFPSNYAYPNNGWPVFISIFFSIFNFENFITYMNLQRFLSVIISVATIIPVYLLCQKFVGKFYSLFGASLFAFEPRIIQNSLLGITEPFFIFVVACTILLFLDKKIKIVYVSFALLGLLSIIRYEGVILVIPLSIMFIIRFRKDKIVLRYLIAIVIFSLIVLPMAYIRTETIGTDGLVSHVSAGGKYYQHISQSSEDGQKAFFDLLFTGSVNFIKYFGWITIPTFIFFIPLGAMLLFRKRNFEKNTIIVLIITLCIPAFYAYSRDLQETRYLLVLFPIFGILAAFSIKKFLEKTSVPIVVACLLISVILVTSLIFLDMKKADFKYQQESFEISKEVIKVAKGTNDLTTIVKYYSAAGLADKKFPILKEEAVRYEPTIVSEEKFSTLDDYIEYGENNKLTHLVLDGNNSKEFLDDVFHHEEKYPYLIKKFDSKYYGFEYKVKIFEINYNLVNTKVNSIE